MALTSIPAVIIYITLQFSHMWYHAVPIAGYQERANYITIHFITNTISILGTALMKRTMRSITKVLIAFGGALLNLIFEAQAQLAARNNISESARKKQVSAQ